MGNKAQENQAYLKGVKQSRLTVFKTRSQDQKAQCTYREQTTISCGPKVGTIQESGWGENWEKAASQVMGEAWQSAKLRSLNFISKHWGATKGF